MTKFNNGDRVKYHGESGYTSTKRLIGMEGVVVGSNNVLFDNGKLEKGLIMDNLELIPSDPIEQAKVILEAAGYTLSPPKPKLAGKVVIYTYTDDNSTFCLNKETYDKNSLTPSWGYARPILAIVDWTEGQGLTAEPAEPDGTF